LDTYSSRGNRIISGIKATICITMTTIMLYFALIFIGNNILELKIADSSAIFLSVLPFITYLILSGKIKEFKGGGIEVKFREVFEKNVPFKSESVHYIDYRTVEKRSRKALANIISEIKRIPRTSLSLTVGAHYDYVILRDYLRELTKFDFFKYVIFIDQNSRVEGFMNARILLSHLNEDQIGRRIIGLIETGAIKEVSGFRKDFVKYTTSSKEVLQILEAKKISDIAIVDENYHFLGFTDRETITAKVILSLLTGS